MTTEITVVPTNVEIVSPEPTKPKGRMALSLWLLFLKVGLKGIGLIAKFGKLGKLALAGGAMASYAYMFTWQFAVVIMLMIGIHEYGHIWAMKRCGMRVKGVYFLPFMGAVAIGDDIWPDRASEAYIAAMGPTWGLIPAFAFFCLWSYTDHPFFALGAAWASVVNLFNLLPVLPLDGGRLMRASIMSLHRGLGLLFMGLGCLLLLVGCVWHGITLFAFLLPICFLELFFEWKMRTKLAGLVKDKKVVRDRAKELRSSISQSVAEAMIPESAQVGEHAIDPELRERMNRDLQAMGAERERHLGDMIKSLDQGIAEDEKIIASDKPMTGAQMLAIIGWTIVLACAFVSIINGVGHIPAAGAGMELFQ